MNFAIWWDKLASIITLFIAPLAAIWMINTLYPGMLSQVTKLRTMPPSGVTNPVSNSILDKLEQQIGLSPGSQFRGYAIPYFGGPEGPLRERIGLDDQTNFSNDNYVQSRFYLEAVYGTTFMMTDLWQKNIPTVNEYGQWITKPLLIFVKHLLADPKDILFPYEINIFRLNIPILQAIGVRFIITDAKLRDYRLTLEETLYHDPNIGPAKPGIVNFAKNRANLLKGAPIPLYLYKISNINNASYSPTKFIFAATADDILNALKNDAFDPQLDVVISNKLPSLNLQPVAQSRMIVNRGNIIIKARSEGYSFLLLPIQFSHCLNLTTKDMETPPLIIRANLIQTGIIFEQNLNVQISFDFGPMGDIACRHLDNEDYNKLNI